MDRTQQHKKPVDHQAEPGSSPPYAMDSPALPLPGYDEFVSDLLDRVFSRAAEPLNELFGSDSFQELFCGKFGLKASSFYFYDSRTTHFREFRQALVDGIECPVFKTSPIQGSPIRYTYERRQEAEVEYLKKLRERLRTSDEDSRISAQLCYDNLNASSRPSRRSVSEAKKDWLVIPRGERSLFSFEWSVLRTLSYEGLDYGPAAAETVKGAAFAEKCWAEIYRNPKYPQMQGQESIDYPELVKWLKQVLSARGKKGYSYLYEDPKNSLNWFISGGDVIRRHLATANVDSVDPSLLQILAQLVVTKSHPFQTDPKDFVNLSTTRFFHRSRLSPQMELLFGGGGVVAFLLTSPGEQSAPVQLNAFVLAVFDDTTLCEAHYSRLKLLFYLLCTRDVVRFSNKSLESTYASIEQVLSIVNTMKTPYYQHELRVPLGKIERHVGDIRSDAEALAAIERSLESVGHDNNLRSRIRHIEELCEETLAQAKRSYRAFEVLSWITDALAGKPKVVVDFYSTVSGLVSDVIWEMRKEGYDFSDEAVHVFRPHSEIRATLDERALRVVLRNLIKNGLEATEFKGEISVTLSREQGQAVVVVEDNGPGISPDLLLFEMGQSTKVQHKKGFGFGLFISKQLVVMQGGAISGCNKQEGGASFRIEFPEEKE